MLTYYKVPVQRRNVLSEEVLFREGRSYIVVLSREELADLLIDLFGSVLYSVTEEQYIYLCLIV